MDRKTDLAKELEEQKQLARELQGRVDELTDFIENASLPLHWVNGSGVIIWANKAELELLGYEKEEYIGKHISNFHADKNTCEDILGRLINKETLRNYPSMLKAKNNKLIPVIINSNVRWDGNKFIHTRCFTRDISDLKDLEREKVNLINELQTENFQLKAEIRSLKTRLQES